VLDASFTYLSPCKRSVRDHNHDDIVTDNSPMRYRSSHAAMCMSDFMHCE